jgi:hypothetical protein
MEPSRAFKRHCNLLAPVVTPEVERRKREEEKNNAL